MPSKVPRKSIYNYCILAKIKVFAQIHIIKKQFMIFNLNRNSTSCNVPSFTIATVQFRQSVGTATQISFQFHDLTIAWTISFITMSCMRCLYKHFSNNIRSLIQSTAKLLSSTGLVSFLLFLVQTNQPQQSLPISTITAFAFSQQGRFSQLAGTLF